MKRHEYFLKITFFCIFMTMACVVSYIPLWLDARGYSKTEIGFVLSLGPLISIGSNLLWGYVSDRFQTIVKILWIILIGQLVTIFFVGRLESFAAVAIVMAFFYFFQTPMITLQDSLTLNSLGGQQGRYASFRVWGSIGFAVTAVVVGYILKSMHSDAILWTVMIAAALTLAVTFGLQDRKGGSVSKLSFAGIWKVIGSPTFLLFLFFLFLMSVAHRANDNFLSLYLQSMGAEESVIGWAMMMSAVSEIPVFFLMARYGHRFKELPLLAFAALVYAVRFALYSIADTAIAIVFLQLMHSFSFGIFLVTAIRYIQNVIPDEYRATGQAVFAVTWLGLAGLASGSIGGVIFDQFGGQATYLFAAISALIAFFSFLALHSYMERKNTAPTSMNS
ncbi:MFS transporter [Paenibacillus turpanensis]|uniref:MFS transporter n=1 Tax=Paenibacillus turpanensis TaxID=2689078 RepID=UPI00140C3D55|nr:MFS transporter [Paenibacillus turpanensis]